MSDHKPITVGRYLLHRKIARGGMATIHIARLMGDVGFSRIVAAKRMHPELAEDREFVAMFLDEARIASKVHHRNVVPVLDVVTMGEEVVLVQEYVHGAPLSLLLRQTCEVKGHVPIPVAASIACQVLAGLHAAHETVDEMGTPLHIVHRDVSPQNIMVATDGTVRLLDFGVAKTSGAGHVTRKGTFKGKLGYSSPEQIRGEANKQSDIYSLGIVLWELLVGLRLHAITQGEAALIAEIMSGRQPTVTDALADDKTFIGSYRWSQLEALDPIIRKALDVNHKRRWASAADMEEAIAQAVPLASPTDTAEWLRAVGGDFLDVRERMIAEEEASWRRTLAMTAAAVPLPTEVHASIGVAAEPESAPQTRTLFRRGPTAIIAVLVVLLAASIAFLMRDLDQAKPRPRAAPAARATASSAITPDRSSVHTTASAPDPSSVQTTVTPGAGPVAIPAAIPPSPTMALPSEADDREAVLEEPVESPPRVPPKRSSNPGRERTSTSRQSARSRARPAPARPPAPALAPAPPPPPPKPAVTTDCSTPFYYEGSKKIFKPGCL